MVDPNSNNGKMIAQLVAPLLMRYASAWKMDRRDGRYTVKVRFRPLYRGNRTSARLGREAFRRAYSKAWGVKLTRKQGGEITRYEVH